MEDIFYFHVCPFIDSKVFHDSKLSLLCKHKYLQERQNKINRTHSACNLEMRFWKNDLKNIMHVFLDDYHHFIKYITSILLKEDDIDILCDSIPFEKNKILVTRYVMSNTIIEFDENNKIAHIDFTSCQDIVDDVEICSIYRLGIVKKQVLLDHYPHAKALIY